MASKQITLPVTGMTCDEALRGDHHRRKTAFHVRSAPAIQSSVADLRDEGIAAPVLPRPGRHDVGMTGEAEHRRSAPAARPEVCDGSEGQLLVAEAACRESRADHVQAAVVVGAHRRTTHEVERQVEGG